MQEDRERSPDVAENDKCSGPNVGPPRQQSVNVME